MEKYLKTLLLLLVATLSLTITSCGGDDDDEPNAPDQSTTSGITKGTVGESKSVNVVFPNSYPVLCGFQVFHGVVSVVDGYNYGTNEICSCGKVSGLSEITTAPSSGWSTSAPLIDGGGYILTYIDGGVSKYVRLMLTTNKSASGEVVGVNYAFQHFTPTNL